ncbi:UMP kinase [Candidatus Kuenenbacteria bacterium]|nr:UMP kinase [Candidatus Kuenenbacteria bacterium]
MPSKKVILKLSGELFCSGTNPIDIDKTFALAKEIIKIKKDYQLGVVFGGGNIFRGRQMTGKKITNQAGWHFVGMSATMVNALALKAAFDELKMPARIISAFDPEKTKKFSNQEILIFAGGTGVPFVTTDSAAVKYALEYRADLILKGTKVSGVYSADPQKNKQAKKFDHLSHKEYSRLKDTAIFDKKAVALAGEHKLPIYVFKWDKGTLAKAVKLQANGTLIL